jgi:predicted NBD/HSP70 family sugar kinase
VIKINKSITGSTETIKKLNKKAVLELVRKNGPISQPEINEKTDLTPATILNLLEELKNKKFIKEHKNNFKPDGIKKTGRPPKYFSLNKEGGQVLGIGFYKDHCDFVITNYGNEIIHYKEAKLNLKDKPMIWLNNIVKEIENIYKQFNFEHIGISLPGIIDEKSGIIIFSKTMQKLVGIPIAQYINEHLEVPISVVHNTIAKTKAEYWFGKNSLRDNMIYILIEEGVGAGMIFNGQIYCGENGYAGELGHTKINFDGRTNNTLNDYISNSSIVDRVYNKVQNGYKSNYFNKNMSKDDYTMEEILKSVKAGEDEITEVIKEGAGYLGKILSNKVLFLNPSLILIEGIICQMPGFIDIVKNSFLKEDSRTLEEISRNLDIRKASYSKQSRAIAGAVHALCKIGLLPEI